MKIKKVRTDRVVITSECGMWCAVVQKKAFRNWQVIRSYAGEWHHFVRRSHYTKLGAVGIAKEFIKKNQK